MKKQLGIVRSRTERLAAVKKEAQRKKNRFHMVGKEEEEDAHTFSLTTTHSDPNSRIQFSEQEDESARALKVFERARAQMKKASDLQRRMAELTKARLSSLREKDNEKYDKDISKLAGEATNLLLSAQTHLRQITAIEGASPSERKVLKSVAASLASEIQGASRSLRSQQQEYFKRIKSYEGSTVNSAIELTAEQREAMRGEWVVEEEGEREEQGRVGELVGSISRLSALYKELAQMVVAQGTVIDRIDYNLEQTEVHTANAIVHLQGAEAAASSPFAEKVIRILAIAVIAMALMLGLKYMK